MDYIRAAFSCNVSVTSSPPIVPMFDQVDDIDGMDIDSTGERPEDYEEEKKAMAEPSQSRLSTPSTCAPSAAPVENVFASPAVMEEFDTDEIKRHLANMILLAFPVNATKADIIECMTRLIPETDDDTPHAMSLDPVSPLPTPSRAKLNEMQRFVGTL